MKNSRIFLFSLLAGLNSYHAQTLTLQPDAIAGKDAFINSLQPSTVGGTVTDLDALAWTNSGNPSTVRGLIDFDLSQIPTGAIINSATLTLYHNPTSSNSSAKHQSLSGSNEGLISRVISTWDENTVTWNTQPQTTTQNEVIIPQSTSENQDYSLDVTDLIKDMINNPSSSYGFMIRLKTEQYYRSLVFASSDHPNASKHPKLEISYSTNVTGIQEMANSKIIIFPNPTSDYVNINIPEQLLGHVYHIYDNNGKKVKEGILVGKEQKIGIDNFSNGIYTIKVNNETQHSFRILKK